MSAGRGPRAGSSSARRSRPRGRIAAGVLFPLDVAVAARFTPTFGVLGGGLSLLVWLYLLMLSLHLGAETSTAVSRDAGRCPAASDGPVTGRAETASRAPLL